jgi:hypothetical protein
MAERMSTNRAIHQIVVFGPAIPAHSLAVSSLNGDRLIYERFAPPFGPEAGQIVSKTDTM